MVADGAAPTFVTFQSGSFRGDQAAKGDGAPVESMPVEIGEVRMKPEAPFQEAKQAVDLSKAEIIVAGTQCRAARMGSADGAACHVERDAAGGDDLEDGREIYAKR